MKMFALFLLHIPNHPVRYDHHGFTGRNQKVEKRLTSRTQFTQCSSQYNTEHNDAKHVCCGRIDGFKIP